MQKEKNKTLIILLIIIIVNNGCGLYMKKVIGYHNIQKKDYPQILAIQDSTTNYRHLRVNNDYFKKIIELEIPDTVKKYFLQPIQILYIKEGKPYAFVANCFIKGSLKGLKWTEDSFFNSFPPGSHIPRHYLSELTNLMHLERHKLTNNTFVLLWSNIATNEAYRALDALSYYITKNKITDALVIIVNTDNTFKEILNEK